MATPRSSGGDKKSSYAQSNLDLSQLKRYAARVASETSLPTNIVPVVEVSSRRVKGTETYRTGLFGWKEKTREVFQTVETRKTIMGSGWLLFKSTHWIEQYNVGRYVTLDYEDRYLWVLDTNGDLWKVDERHGFEEFKSGGTNRRSDRSARPMTETDILALDHEYPYRVEPSRSRDNIRGNYRPGRLIRHAKGVGLSLALKSILEGKHPSHDSRPGDRGER